MWGKIMKQIRIENNTDWTLKIQVTEFNKQKSQSELLNSHNVIIRKATLERGDTWSINHITEEEMSTKKQDKLVTNKINNSKHWFRFW